MRAEPGPRPDRAAQTLRRALRRLPAGKGRRWLLALLRDGERAKGGASQ